MKNSVFVAISAALLLVSESTAQTSNLDAALEATREAINTPGFSGAVIILHNGEPVLEEVRGLADQVSGRENTLQTRFNIASIGKFITAAAYVRSIDQARFDQSPAELLPEDSEWLSPDLRVSDLLAHRTNVESYITAPDGERRLLATQSNADVFQLVRESQNDPVAPRFDGLAYNNSNAIITGQIISNLNDTSYEAAVEALIFTPAGASSAEFARLSQSTELDLSLPYVETGFDPESMQRPQPGQQLPSLYPVQAHSPLTNAMSSAAGGLYMSVPDLAQIGAATMDGRVLSLEELTIMCTSQLPVPRLILGLGCGGRDFGPGKQRWGHNGGAPGVNAELAIFPDQGLVVAIASNHNQRGTPILQAFETAYFGLGED